MLVSTYAMAWGGALWRDSAARKWYCRFMVVGVALPFLSGLGFMCLKYSVDWTSPSPPSSVTLDAGFRLIYALAAVMFVGPVLQLVALAVAVKSYPRGSWKRRRAIIDAIRQAEPPTAGEPEP